MYGKYGISHNQIDSGTTFFQQNGNGTRFWPGLGRSDSDYALVLMSYPLFEVATTPLSGALLHRLPFTVPIVAFVIVYITGGVVYALAGSVVMAFLGYGLFGMAALLGSVTVHTYISEMGTVMDKIRKKHGKKPTKLYSLYFLLFCSQCRTSSTSR